MQSTDTKPLAVPLKKSPFLNEDPKTLYSRERAKRENTESLQSRDTTYALIERHVGRLKSREKSPQVEAIMRGVPAAARFQVSPIKVGELVSAQGSLQSFPHRYAQMVVDDEVLSRNQNNNL